MNPRENVLRAVRFRRPAWIPMKVNVSSACWSAYPQAELQRLLADHPLLFPGFEASDEPVVPDHPPWRRADRPYTDSWGCVWRTAEDGVTGAVIEHALSDWSKLASYRPPSPDEQNGWGPIDWPTVRKNLAAARRAGRLAAGGLRHGHTFLTLTYLRGYENLLYDMADEDPRLEALVAKVEAFNLGLVRRYIEAGVEWLGYPEDLGMQQGPMLSPGQFRRYILPSYRRLVAPAKAAGCVIHMHSDGDIRTLCDDLLAVGVDAINLQDRVNGVDWIGENLKGRVCIDLDVDRQSITRFGTPGEVGDHVRGSVEALAHPAGGLMLNYGLYPGTPLDNARAVMDAMEACMKIHA